MTDIATLAEGLSGTIPAYWRDSYQAIASSNILRVAPDEKKYWYIVLDKTIFHPKGGGQPSDRGVLEGNGFKLEVKKAMLAGPVIVHWGKMVDGKPEPGLVKARIDWQWRYLMMRRHSAGHLLDHCLAQVARSQVETLDSWLGDPCYVAYKGEPIQPGELAEVEKVENQAIAQGAPVSAHELTTEELRRDHSVSTNIGRLPSLQRVRMVTIQGCRPIPCGGTHLRNISEVNRVRIGRAETGQEGFRVYYDVV